MSGSICLFGDSVGRGVVLDGAKRKYQLIKDNFAALFSGITGVPVCNYSSFGCTIPKGGKAMERHLGELEAYDSILLEFGGNDCDYNWKEISEHPEENHQPNTPIEEFTRQYRNMVQTIRRKAGNPVLLTLPPLDAERYFSWISAGLDKKNLLRFLGDVSRIYQWHEYYNMAVCRIAAQQHTVLLDIRSAFLARRDYRSLICEDGIHPNRQGHALISSVLAESLPLLLPSL